MCGDVFRVTHLLPMQPQDVLIYSQCVISDRESAMRLIQT